MYRGHPPRTCTRLSVKLQAAVGYPCCAHRTVFNHLCQTALGKCCATWSVSSCSRRGSSWDVSTSFWEFYGLSETNSWPADTNESANESGACSCCRSESCFPFCLLLPAPLLPAHLPQLLPSDPVKLQGLSTQPSPSPPGPWEPTCWGHRPVLTFSPLLPSCCKRAGPSTGRGRLLLRASRAVVASASGEQLVRRLAAVSVLRCWLAFLLPQFISSSDCAFVSSASTLQVQFLC